MTPSASHQGPSTCKPTALLITLGGCGLDAAEKSTQKTSTWVFWVAALRLRFPSPIRPRSPQLHPPSLDENDYHPQSISMVEVLGGRGCMANMSGTKIIPGLDATSSQV
ncbi:hypothetical protein IWZ00DRAFT_492302 [Phyllosticta capitalensis]|uniref:Uncharacterized protein n=1 Tax=Phyllosticta capitalensis TaxID=121624 RepID=A0ABR1YN44_9PEZI